MKNFSTSIKKKKKPNKSCKQWLSVLSTFVHLTTLFIMLANFLFLWAMLHNGVINATETSWHIYFDEYQKLHKGLKYDFIYCITLLYIMCRPHCKVHVLDDLCLFDQHITTKTFTKNSIIQQFSVTKVLRCSKFVSRSS